MKSICTTCKNKDECRNNMEAYGVPNVRIDRCKEYEKEHKLTDEQIKNLEDDGFFSDLDAERYRLSVELYNED